MTVGEYENFGNSNCVYRMVMKLAGYDADVGNHTCAKFQACDVKTNWDIRENINSRAM